MCTKLSTIQPGLSTGPFWPLEANDDRALGIPTADALRKRPAAKMAKADPEK
jgi:hypothetical protein